MNYADIVISRFCDCISEIIKFDDFAMISEGSDSRQGLNPVRNQSESDFTSKMLRRAPGFENLFQLYRFSRVQIRRQFYQLPASSTASTHQHPLLNMPSWQTEQRLRTERITWQCSQLKFHPMLQTFKLLVETGNPHPIIVHSSTKARSFPASDLTSETWNWSKTFGATFPSNDFYQPQDHGVRLVFDLNRKKSTNWGRWGKIPFLSRIKRCQGASPSESILIGTCKSLQMACLSAAW